MTRNPTQGKSKAFMDIANELERLGFKVVPDGWRDDRIYSKDDTPILLGRLFQEPENDAHISYRFPMGGIVTVTDMDALLRHLEVAPHVFNARDDQAWLYSVLVDWVPGIRFVRNQVRLGDMRIVADMSRGTSHCVCVNAYGQTYVFRNLAELRVNLRRGMDTAFTTYAG